MIETLESRRLLAVTVSASGGVLNVSADKDENTINVVENAGAVHVETSVNGGPITAQDFAGITAINVVGGNDDDTIFYSGNSVGANIKGDKDNGGHGDDQISVDDEGTGSSTVDGGNGNDVITVIRGNNTHVSGGNGDDQIFVNTGGDSTASVVADGDNGKDTFTVYAGTNTLDGGNGKDALMDLGGTNTSSNM